MAELAFARKAAIEPHTNPNTTWFLVIEGGGFVQVGDETARVSAGEAVLWPAGVVHGASTDLSEMRAIVVELAGADDAAVRGIVPGRRLALDVGTGRQGRGGARDDRPPRLRPDRGRAGSRVVGRLRASPRIAPSWPRIRAVAPQTRSSSPSRRDG